MSSSPITPDWPTILRAATDARQASVWTALPARVKSYDAATQTADLEPVVRNPRALDEEPTLHEELPVLPNVPVVFPRGGGCSITWPIAAGDHVLVVFSTLSFSQWRRTGATGDAVDLRRNDLGASFAIAGIAPALETLPSAEEPALVLTADEVRLGSMDASDFVALESKVNQRIAELADAILSATPTANDGGAAIQTAALASLGAAGWSGTTPPSMAAQKVKAE